MREIAKIMNDSKGDRGRGRGDRGRRTRGRRGRPRKMTGVPLDLGEAEAGTSNPPPTSTPVGLPAMRMIPTPGPRVQSFEIAAISDAFPPVDNPFPEGEEGDIALEEELARQAGRVYLSWDGGNCWNKVRKGTAKITWVFESYYKWFVPQFSKAPPHAVQFWWDCWRASFRLQRGYEYRIYESWRMRVAKRLHEEDFKKLKQVNKKNRASSTGGSLHTGGSTTYEATRERMDAYDAELKRLQEVRCPPIDKAAVWARVAGCRKRGRVYGMGVVPSHKYPQLFSDPDDDDTASGPPDLKEQVTLLNREITQQAEAHAQRVAAVEVVCAEKVRTLESTVQTQSQEVSDLRRAYSDMYIFLTQMRSYSSGSMPDMPPPPPPPPPAPPQTPPPQHDQSTGSPHHDDNTDYV
ncbi:hypothetical protein PIB30_026609 [Stylosanthes scabra]|uniref:Transposase, Ptta/En/Spm, plant n=1 Tax=Stylosanthes scabra TaxID=79078 RepID=A0ABU6V8L2_9FABA|nr:hypothetical protein [Stylosanthes scabra]